ncbi:hypothetical protein niasHT_003076 [Heterodera trifolii]|uniref:CAP-Gly domain-containing protein n=1 Tax=Heterodera trifolii TaxID=157864 RepID=A0ABD2M4U4_9BILA
MKKTPSKESVFSTCSEAQSSETFAVGETVKVGERTGRVAFVGRTQFQPGEWVGLILDTPDGKNNGSVNGIKYFECNERHGLFCRPSKLVKIRPTLSSFARSPRVPPAVSVAGARSPTNSVYSVAFSVANSQAGGSRERSPYAAQFGAGKVKFLNYVADQIFAGIVLDRPLGDSDGKFQGIQYFKCYPKYATFLPAHLLKKAATTIASNALPPRKTPRPTKASQLRTDKGALLGGMAFKGSRESLDSLMRSPPPGHIHASSCVKHSPTGIKDSDIIVSLKKCLQEKEAHLAKLSIELSERSNDADRLAHENLNLKLRISELDADLNATERQLALKSQEMQRGIDERDKRLDDLSFCFTEAELKKEELEQRMKEMTAMPTLYEEDKPKMAVFERKSDQADLTNSEMQMETEEKMKTFTFSMQTDQTDLIDADMQTETEEKTKMTNELTSTEMQTEPEQKPKTLIFAMQTDQTDLTNSEMQTISEEKPKTVTFSMQTDQTDLIDADMQTETEEKTKMTNELTSTEMQTEPEQKPKTLIFAMQTDQTDLIDSEMQTIPEEKPKKITFAMQTDQSGLIDSEMQTETAEKPKTVTFAIQTDQTDLIDAEMQAETEEKTKMTNELTSTEMQTEPEQKPKTLTFSIQTDQTDLTNSEMQTITEEKPKTVTFAIQTDQTDLIDSEMQTIPEEKPKKITFAMQTDQSGLIDSEMQTETAEKPKTVTFAMQTVQINLIDSEMQTLSEEKSKMTNDEVLELNVSKLPMDADSSFLSNQGRSSPLLDESLRRKYNEKCEEMAELRHAYEFQQSIISNQLDEISRLKQQQQQLRNGVQKNGSPSSTRHPTIAAAVSPSSVFPSGALPTISGRPRAARRTYCEHCEMFDAHDSSECPKEEAKRAERRDHEALSPQKWDERERTFWH